jgi:uncharacterized membrane protein YkoI
MKATAFALVTAALCACPAATWAGEDEDRQIAEAQIALGEAQLTMQEAIETALLELPDGKAVEAELDLAADGAEFEVEIISGGKHMEVALDASDGRVKEVEEVDDEDQEERQCEEAMAEAGAAGAKITLGQAVAAAVEKVSGGKAFEAEAERDGDKLVFEIELLSGDRLMEVQVDAVTGEVLETSQED